MSITVIAGADATAAPDLLVAALRGRGAEAEALDLDAPGGASGVEAIASALRRAESAWSDRPDAVVLTAVDDSSLAAALVATKLEVPLLLAAEVDSRADDARILGLLANATLATEPEAAAGEILDFLDANASPASAS